MSQYQDTVIAMGDTLERAVNALRGAPSPGFAWSTHDVGELAAKAAAVANALVAYQDAPDDPHRWMEADRVLAAALLEWRAVIAQTAAQRAALEAMPQEGQ